MISRRTALEMQLTRHRFSKTGRRLRAHTIEALEQRTVLDASLQLIHNSPYDLIGTFDLYVNDVLLVNNFAFQNATPFLNFAPGTYNIEFADSDAPDSSNPFYSTSITLADNTLYVALTQGNPEVASGPQALTLAVSPLARQFAQNPANVEFFLYHGVPDSPPIDVTARGGAILANDLAFGSFGANYVSVPPAPYTLDVTFGGGEPRVVSFDANLTNAAGGAFVIAASDYLNPPPGVFGDPRFALLAVFADGSAFRLPDVLPQPLPTLSLSSVSANEGNAGTTAFLFTASLSANSNLPVTVGYATSNGTASAASDYTATSGTLTFASNVTSQVVTVLVNGDTTSEANEAFSVSLSGAVGATLGTAIGVGTIQNDDSANAPVINFPSGFAGAAAQLRLNGSSPASIVGTNLQLTAASQSQRASAYFQTPVSVTSFTTHFDFQLTPGTTNIGEGITFVLQNSGPTAVGSSGQGLGYTGITRSVAVKFDTNSNSGEGTNSTGQYTNGSTPTSQRSINLNNSGISLRSGHIFGVDMTYDGTTLLVTITDQTTLAQATQSYAVNIASVVGANTAYVGFTGSTGSNTAVQNIRNWTYSNAPLPSVSVSAVSANEGNTGSTADVFTVNLSAASSQAVTVRYATSNGTATAGSDYTAASGTLTFAPGVTVQLVTVNVSGDTANETDETFSLVLSSPVGITLGTATGTGTIVNDDAAPSLSINNVVASEGNFGSTPFVFTASLSAASGQPVTVLYATSAGTATAGSDYTTASGTLTFAPGTTSQLVTVLVAGDLTIETDEAFTVALSGATGATIGTATGTGTIQNEDSANAPVVNFPTGFAGASTLFSFNGISAASIVGTNLQVTDGGKNEVASAYFRTPVNVTGFATHFDFQLLPGTSNIGDGFTFVIQNSGLRALGRYGGDLGYGGISRSVAVKFDTYSNSGEGTNSTGQYSNGATPTSQRSVNLTNTGINLRSGHVFSADMTYDGTTLVVTITDRTTLAQATQRYTVNIPSIVGASTAYVGFTGGTGTNTAVQNILNWTYTTGAAPAAAPTAIAAAIEAVRTEVSVEKALVHSIITASSVASTTSVVTAPATVTSAVSKSSPAPAAVLSSVIRAQVATALADADLNQLVHDDLLELLAKSSASLSKKKAILGS